MPHIHSRHSKPATAALVLLFAALTLAACGSSANSSSSTGAGATGTSASTSKSSGNTAKGTLSGRFAALRECLQKNGIAPPKRTPGQQPGPGAGGFFGGVGGPTLPKGMTRARYEAILKTCGGGFFPGGRLHRGTPGIGSRLNSPAVTGALAKFAACMRENGVDVPAPNTSGKGPIFSTKGLNTTGSAFRTAETKCRGELQKAFRARPGAGGTSG